MDTPYSLPSNLPVPADDGAALHLQGRALPDLALPSTSGHPINLRHDLLPKAVLFFYPRTGIPGQPPHHGFNGEEWDSIPGARGCTPQSCGFRDLHAEFQRLGVSVFGVSTNTTAHQREFVERTHMPFAFLSDSDLALTKALRLPTFAFPVESGGPDTLIRRMAWYVEEDVIRKVWYPVFPPDKNAETVLAWLTRRAEIRIVPVTPTDLDYIRAELHKHWRSTTIRSIGRAYAADQLPGFIARIGGEPVGLVTYHIDGDQCEVVTLSSAGGDGKGKDRGIGTALLDAAVSAAHRAGCRRVFLTTTNDNLRALRFYQRHGWRMVAVHRGMMDTYREREPHIPWIGMNGIPLRDEIELEMVLQAGNLSPRPG